MHSCHENNGILCLRTRLFAVLFVKSPGTASGEGGTEVIRSCHLAGIFGVSVTDRSLLFFILFFFKKKKGKQKSQTRIIKDRDGDLNNSPRILTP